MNYVCQVAIFILCKQLSFADELFIASLPTQGLSRTCHKTHQTSEDKDVLHDTGRLENNIILLNNINSIFSANITYYLFNNIYNRHYFL